MLWDRQTDSGLERLRSARTPVALLGGEGGVSSCWETLKPQSPPTALLQEFPLKPRSLHFPAQSRPLTLHRTQNKIQIPAEVYQAPPWFPMGTEPPLGAPGEPVGAVPDVTWQPGSLVVLWGWTTWNAWDGPTQPRNAPRPCELPTPPGHSQRHFTLHVNVKSFVHDFQEHPNARNATGNNIVCFVGNLTKKYSPYQKYHITNRDTDCHWIAI